MILTDRLNIFTGDHGLDKSFVLDLAWWALTETWFGNTLDLNKGSYKDTRVLYRGSSFEKMPSEDYLAMLDVLAPLVAEAIRALLQNSTENF